MANTYYGKQILGELSDAQTLPSTTSVDSTNMVYVGDNTNGKLHIAVHACTAISIADGKALTIALQTWSADVAANAIAPFSSAGAVLANSTPVMNIFYGLASGGAMSWLAGDLIVDVAVPEDMMALFTTPHDYVQLVYTTTANESSETVDAFVYTKM